MQGHEIDIVELIQAVEATAEFLPSIPQSVIAEIAAQHKDVQQDADAHGSEHPITLERLLRLTESYIDIRMYECSVKIFDRIVLGLKRCYGKDHVLVPKALSRKAFCFKEQRLYEKAIEYYLQALARFELLFGNEHELLLPVLDGLGFSYLKLKRAPLSEIYYIRLLRYHQQRNGAEDPDTLAAVTKLASAYQEQHKHSDAEYICDSALDACVGRLGKNHPITQRAVMTLAHVKHAQGRTRQAEQMYRKALACNEQELGMQHVETLSVVELIAALLAEQGSCHAAEAMYRRAMRGYETEMGPDSMRTIAAAQNVGRMLVQLRQPEEALQLFRRAYDAYLAYYGAQHPETIEAKYLTGQAYHVQSLWRHRPDAAQQQRAAIDTFEQALEGLDDALGPQHQRSVEVVETLANVLLQANDFKRALPYWRRLYDALATKAATTDDKAAAIAYQLAAVYERLSDYTAAVKYFKEAHGRYRWQLQELDMRLQHDSETLTTVSDSMLRVDMKDSKAPAAVEVSSAATADEKYASGGDCIPQERQFISSKAQESGAASITFDAGDKATDGRRQQQQFGDSLFDVSVLSCSEPPMQGSGAELVDDSLFSSDGAGGCESLVPGAAAAEQEQLDNRVAGAGRRALLSRASTANTATWELEMRRDELQQRMDDALEQYQHALRRTSY